MGGCHTFVRLCKNKIAVNYDTMHLQSRTVQTTNTEVAAALIIRLAGPALPATPVISGHEPTRVTIGSSGINQLLCTKPSGVIYSNRI